MTDLYNVDDAGTCWLTEQGIIELAYQNKLQDSLFEWQDDHAKQEYERMCAQEDNWPFLIADMSQSQHRNWFTPDTYVNLDLDEFVLMRCATPRERERASYELKLVHHLEVSHIFKHLIYLVDTWRSKNLVWGIGRGSSVSCFLLYVIGLNRINPLDYDLDPEEFFKCALPTD